MSAVVKRRFGAGGGRRPASGIAELLRFAAAPLFAVMAVVTGFSDETAMDVLCAAIHGTSWLNGMAPMYALMSVVHLPCWLGPIRRETSPAS